MSDIASLVARSLAGFNTLLETGTGSDVVSHLARFKIWAGGIGAHRFPGSRSLEYRLRDASSLRNHIIHLLQELCDLLDEAASLAIDGDNPDLNNIKIDPDTQDDLGQLQLDGSLLEEPELDQVLGEIGGVIDCLLRLSVAISNPAPHDQFASRSEGAVIDSYAPWDLNHVHEKFPMIDDGITERLGKAITVRRRYFKYREEHHNRLAAGLESDTPGVIAACEETTVASSLPEHLKDAKQLLDDRKPPLHDFADFGDAKSEISRTSYALSSADPSQSRVPPLPKEHADGPFVCLFCYNTVIIDSRHDWKKHVFRDLRPYLCLASDCPTPDHQYTRRAEWTDHMNEVHWRIWRCPFGCPQDFQTAQGLRAHAQAAHSETISENNLDSLSNLTSCLDQTKAHGNCPLCHTFQVTSAQQYASHIGTHLELLSLFALPKSWSDNESEEDGATQDHTDDFDDDSSVAETVQGIKCSWCWMTISKHNLHESKLIVECGHRYCDNCLKEYYDSYDEPDKARLDPCFACEIFQAEKAAIWGPKSKPRSPFRFPSPPPTQAEGAQMTVDDRAALAITYVIAIVNYLYQRVRGSGPQFLNIVFLITGLRSVLERLHAEIETPNILLRVKQRGQFDDQLTLILDNCAYRLKQLVAILEHEPAINAGSREAEQIGNDSGGNTVGERSAKHEDDIIAIVRTTLLQEMRKINAFLDTVQLHDPAQTPNPPSLVDSTTKSRSVI